MAAVQPASGTGSEDVRQELRNLRAHWGDMFLIGHDEQGYWAAGRPGTGIHRADAALAVAALAACSSGGSGSAAGAASSPTSVVIASLGTAGVAANPVPLLLESGVKQNQFFAPGTDIYGDRHLSGIVDKENEQVTAWTFTSQAAQQADLARNANPSDGSRIIEGNLWAVSVVPVTAMNGDMTFPVSLASIARLVGGKVVGG